jgi:hypothetical protein
MRMCWETSFRKPDLSVLGSKPQSGGVHLIQECLLLLTVDIPQQTVTVVWGLLLGLPISTLSISWLQHFRNRKIQSERALWTASVLLITLTLSYLLFACGAYWITDYWRGFHRELRPLTIWANLIWANLAITLGIAIYTFWKPLWAWISISAVVMLLIWFYASIFSFVV